ncbi:MAG: hypothetical protein ACYDD1_10240 [Caulobacteraceae bacterium]
MNTLTFPTAYLAPRLSSRPAKSAAASLKTHPPGSPLSYAQLRRLVMEQLG